MSELLLSQELISPEVFDEVVKQIGPNGGELLTAVETDVFCAEQQEQETPCEQDQKHYIAWSGVPTEFVEYPEAPPPQQLLYGAPTLPPDYPQIPANVDYAGHLDFDILISSHTANRNSWIYSQSLNKVFINMANVLPVDVKRSCLLDPGVELYLRATLLYSLPQFAAEMVERCSTHADPRLGVNRDVDGHVMRHVLRCTNPGSVYHGDPERREHLSVVTLLQRPQAGVETVRVNYQFMCKNSCPSGMNRRAVDVIFTLEDARRNVLGRRKLSVRVCSCPKRDKEKEEKEQLEQISSQNQHGRKRKMQGKPRQQQQDAAPPAPPDVTTGENKRIHTLNFDVFGTDVVYDTLRFAQDRMLANSKLGKYNAEQEQQIQHCVNKIVQVTKRYKESLKQED